MFILLTQPEDFFGHPLANAGANLDAGALPTEEETRTDGQQAADELASEDGPPLHPVLAEQDCFDLGYPGADQVGEVDFNQLTDQP